MGAFATGRAGTYSGRHARRWPAPARKAGIGALERREEEAKTTPSSEVQPQGDLGKSYRQFEPHSRTEGGHGPGGIWRVGPRPQFGSSDGRLADPGAFFLYAGPLLPLLEDRPWFSWSDRQPESFPKERHGWVFCLVHHHETSKKNQANFLLRMRTRAQRPTWLIPLFPLGATEPQAPGGTLFNKKRKSTGIRAAGS